jgi:PmbA protein
VIAGQDDAKQRDYDYSVARYSSDVADAVSIGTHAAQRTLKKLNPRKVKSCEVPVIFDPRVGRGLIGQFASAISGTAIARGTSFLKDAMHTAIFHPSIQIVDEPHRIRGLGSKPFDGEGVQNGARALIEKGELKSWMLDMRSANQLGLITTGHAARGLDGSPHPSSTNLTLLPSDISPQALTSDIKQGFYVTETFGMGINLITGDYSQGASGFWIENGEMTYAVSEVTIASNLRDMFKTMSVADDLIYRYATNAPTLRIARMTIAGA